MKQERVWLAVTMVAAVMLVCVLLFDQLAATPKPKTSPKKHRDQLAFAAAEIDRIEERSAEVEEKQAKGLWTGNPEKIGAAVLSRINREAGAAKVKLIAFRPQRVEQDADLQHVPFLVLVEGPYPEVLQFVRSLETPEGKIAVHLLQFSSSDGTTDRVNASIGLTAFTHLEVPKKDVTPKPAAKTEDKISG